MTARLALYLAVAFALSFPLAAADHTALDKYVTQPDGAYRYELISQTTTGGNTLSVLELVSQTWLTDAEVDRTEWKHWLLILKPEKIAGSTGLLYINGGSNDGRPPSAPDVTLLAMAAELGTVVADLRMVPNQPLRFAGEEQRRAEDALIAYSWRKFLETGDDRWPARLPMTKSAVRAMDAVTAFCATAPGGSVKLDRFVVAGGSKRGWTAWTTAAVDKRVIAVAPLVIDALNVEASFLHHWRAYGFWAPAIQDYVDVDLMKWIGTDQFRALMEIEDPYSYRDRLAMPKYLVNSAGDQFFLPDSAQFYYNDLPGEKYLRYVPNTDHSLNSPDAALGLVGWLQAILNCTPRPRFYWKTDREAGAIRVRTVDPPSAVKLWQASNPNARDFRLMTIGRAWRSSPMEGRDGIYLASVPRPEQGFTAFFVELTYDDRGRFPMVFTTEVVVTPDAYPFELPVASAHAQPRANR